MYPVAEERIARIALKATSKSRSASGKFREASWKIPDTASVQIADDDDGGRAAYSLREFGEHDGRCLIGRSSRETLPKFFGNERHEGVEESKTVVENGVEGVLSGKTSFSIGRRVGDELDGFL